MSRLARARPRQTVLDVERNGFRISLRDIQQAPEYARLINECLDEVGTAHPRNAKEACGAGPVTCSSHARRRRHRCTTTSSTASYCKCSGTKHVSVAALEHDSRLRQRELDRYLDGAECDFETMQAAAETFRLDPGVGVYLPSYVPHWVETEAGISISFSIPFYTARSRAGPWRAPHQQPPPETSPFAPAGGAVGTSRQAQGRDVPLAPESAECDPQAPHVTAAA